MDWCILRTSARHTLRLAETIANEGIEAWTPSEVSRPRVPGRRARLTLRSPILPRFVFADASRLLELIALSHRPLAGFVPMSDGGRYAVVKEASLEPLRTEEEKRERQRLRNIKAKPLKRGQRIAMPRGAWEGLSGIVEHSTGKVTKVDLGPLTIEIDTWLLAENDVREAEARPRWAIADRIGRRKLSTAA